MSAHERWDDAAASYILGALPEAERAQFEAHLEGCPACREELEELRVAAEALPVAAPPMRPPPALKARIMAEVEREAALLQGAREPDEPRRRRFAWPRFALPMPAVAALACGALLVGLGAGAFLFGGSGGQTVHFERAGGLTANASAELDVSDGRAVLVARGLPEPAAGRVYQVWLQRDGRAPEPDAVFTVDRMGRGSVGVLGDVKGAAKVLVTDEPRGGSDVPTRQPVVAGRLS